MDEPAAKPVAWRWFDDRPSTLGKRAWLARRGFGRCPAPRLSARWRCSPPKRPAAPRPRFDAWVYSLSAFSNSETFGFGGNSRHRFGRQVEWRDAQESKR